MPPDPILALLSFAGLMVYGVIGGVVGIATVRLFDPKVGSERNCSYIRGIAGEPGMDTDAWIGFTFAAALWPAVIALGIAGGAIAGVAILPIWSCRRVGKYLARAQIKENDA